MADAKKDNRCVIGIDGGGTHTSFCLVSTQGDYLGEYEERPLSYARLQNRFAEALAKMTARVLRKAGVNKTALRAAAVCFTGIGRERDRKLVRAKLRHLRFAPIVIVDSDFMAALTGALGTDPGIVLLAGTGSVAFARDRDGILHRVGGWGYLIGDEGSGFAVARDGMNAALQDFDGRGPKTQLRTLLGKKFHLDRIDEIISRVYRQVPDRGEIASLAPLIFQAAKDGDAVAQSIIERAGMELGRLIAAALAHFREPEHPVRVAFMGNLFQEKQMMIPAMLTRNANAIRIIEPRFSPAIGAALLALQAMKIAIDENMLNRLETTYRNQ